LAPGFFSGNPVENGRDLLYNRGLAVETDSHSQEAPIETGFAVHQMIPLSALRPGEVAEVCQIVGQADQVRRLQELGLCDGARLEMIRSGSPCIVRLGTSRLCLRDVRSLRVLVTTRMSA
jgi:ferrous iron transport protein A